MKLFRFSLLVLLVCCSNLVHAQNPPYVTYTPVTVPHTTNIPDFSNNNPYSNSYNEVSRDNTTNSLGSMQLVDSSTTFGYYYSQKKQDFVKIHLKVNVYEFWGRQEIYIVATKGFGEERWKNSASGYKAQKLSKYDSNDKIMMDDFEYKAKCGLQTIYFNY